MVSIGRCHPIQSPILNGQLYHRRGDTWRQRGEFQCAISAPVILSWLHPFPECPQRSLVILVLHGLYWLIDWSSIMFPPIIVNIPCTGWIPPMDPVQPTKRSPVVNGKISPSIFSSWQAFHSTYAWGGDEIQPHKPENRREAHGLS